MSRLTDHDLDVVHDRKELVQRLVRHQVNELTHDLTPEQDRELRQQLTDEFRFWRTEP